MGKVCTKCKVEKDLTEFGKNKIRKDGLTRYCKICKRLADKKYNESEAGQKRINKYKQSDKGKENRYEYNRRDEVKERNNKRVTEDRKNNPEVYLWRRLLKYACERMNTTKSASTIEMLKYSADELFEHLYSLGYKENDHIDHKIPLSWFHADTPQHIVNHLSNLQPLDPQTNISKGNSYADKVDEEYYRMARPYLL